MLCPLSVHCKRLRFGLPRAIRMARLSFRHVFRTKFERDILGIRSSASRGHDARGVKRHRASDDVRSTWTASHLFQQANHGAQLLRVERAVLVGIGGLEA